MLSRDEYIRQSLEINLFFLRIMKEHAIFLQAALPTKNADLAQTGAYYQGQLEQLLQEIVLLSSGVIGREELKSGQYVTPFTAEAERMTQFYTAIPINGGITAAEEALKESGDMAAGLENAVDALNRRIITAITAFIGFQTKLRNDVATCRLFMNTYWLLLDHILRETHHYLGVLMALQSRSDTRDRENTLARDETFWNNIMAEHAKFVRGLLDPTEGALIDTADHLAKRFDALTDDAQKAAVQLELLPGVTSDSLAAVEQARDFNAAGTGGLNDCKIKAIILPLLGDHVLRESNHFMAILKRDGSEA